MASIDINIATEKLLSLTLMGTLINDTGYCWTSGIMDTVQWREAEAFVGFYV